MSPGMVFAWLLAAVLATVILRFATDEPWASVLPFTLIGAVAGGLAALAIEDTVPAGFVGAVLGAGVAAGVRLMLSGRHSEG